MPKTITIELADELRMVYGDAIAVPGTTKQHEAMGTRTLQWKSEQRVALSTAAYLYSQIPTYNEYRACLMPHLAAEFFDSRPKARV